MKFPFALTAEPILKTRSLLGEGAIWNYRDQILHWVDIDKFEIHSYSPKTNKDSCLKLDEYVGTVVRRAPARGGGFIAALTRSIAHVAEDGSVTKLVELNEHPRNRSNDGKCDPAGRFFCGSFNFDLTPGACNFWMLDNDLSLHHKLNNIGVSNGLVWTRDKRTMYYIDTPSGCVEAFDYAIETGGMTNRRVAFKNEWGGFFDGMTIDSDDNVLIALWEGGAVVHVNPRTGKLIQRIKVPGARNVTSCALGGEKLDELYITSSAKDVSQLRQPNAGALFRIRLSNIYGVEAFEFNG